MLRRMESNEVLRQALRKTSPKAVAAELGVSLSLVYKWTEPTAESGSGSRNPLDRLQKVIELSGDKGIVRWLCQQNGGHFVENPDFDNAGIRHVLTATQEIISQFSELLSHISEAAIDQSIKKGEAEEIREVWDKLKSYAEGFVVCCENGDFEQMLHIPPPSTGPQRLKIP
jgi:transposase